jgi:hypothetical protein
MNGVADGSIIAADIAIHVAANATTRSTLLLRLIPEDDERRVRISLDADAESGSRPTISHAWKNRLLVSIE